MATSAIPPFYLNVVLLNKAEVIRDKVKERTGLRAGGLFVKAIGFAANKLVTDETVVASLASNLKEKIEAAVAEMGISAVVSKVFQQGAYVVMSVSVTEVDKLTLLLATKGAEYASLFSNLLTTLTALGLAETALPKIDEKIHSQVHELMMKRFAEIVPTKMADAGLEVDCNVLPSESQAEFFYELLQKINDN